MPKPVRSTRAVLPLVAAVAAVGAAALVAPSPSSAQVPATNDVAACSLLADPTAQRSCIESARQKRAATSFDPSASRVRVPHPGDGDATRRRRARRGGDAASAAAAAPAAENPNQIP